MARVLSVINKPNSADEVARAVESDAGLSARLLRLANAPAYGFPRRIRTVGHAVALLGNTVVRGLAVGGAVFDRSSETRALWAHSYGVALVARHLARTRGDDEEAFTSGLLHDVGIALVNLQHPMQAHAIREEASHRGVHVSLIEREVLGYDHAELGAALLQAWSLPPNVVHAVAYHHRPGEAASSLLMASLVHVADFLVGAVGQAGTFPSAPPMRTEAWLLLGLDGHALEKLKPEVLELLEGLPALE